MFGQSESADGIMLKFTKRLAAKCVLEPLNTAETTSHTLHCNVMFDKRAEPFGKGRRCCPVFLGITDASA
jgi:hypothetical protein